MIRLLYCSQSKPEVDDEDIKTILLASRKNNKANSITGALAYGGGLFMQVLEGPEANVLRTYVNILNDKRHTDCRIIHISPAKERAFSNWHMGVIERDPLEFEKLAELRSRRMETVQAEKFSQLMREFNGILMAQPA